MVGVVGRDYVLVRGEVVVDNGFVWEYRVFGYGDDGLCCVVVVKDW